MLLPTSDPVPNTAMHPAFLFILNPCRNYLIIWKRQIFPGSYH
jgi:hypothetical protein